MSIYIKDQELAERLEELSENCGIPRNKLATLLLRHVLSQVDQGGKITVDLADGSLHVGPALPAMAQRTPPRPKQQAMTSDPNDVREIRIR